MTEFAQEANNSDVAAATSEDDRGEPSKKRSKVSQMEKCEDDEGGGDGDPSSHEVNDVPEVDAPKVSGF